MKSATAKSTKQANEMLRSGEHHEVILDFKISTDDFFALADRWGERGAKIKKEDGRFLVKLPK